MTGSGRRTTWYRVAAPIVASAFLLLTHCDFHGDPPSVGVPDPASTTRSAPRDPQPCDLATSLEVEALMGRSLTGLPDDMALGPLGRTCRYPALQRTVMVSISPTAAECHGGNGSEPVPGIGDEAFFLDDNNLAGHHLAVGKGNACAVLSFLANDLPLTPAQALERMTPVARAIAARL